MNSYFKSNRDYRELYQKEKEEGVSVLSSKYPDNISLHDFFMFLLHPTFVYEQKYPTSD